ncbi:hypothetical protein JCM11641_006190 [Rhodosporidiobolus odoratus]
MSSFDQSRGYTIPSGFTRQDSTTWHTSDAWATSSNPPPQAHLPPPSALFAPEDQPLTSTHTTLDYSVIDQPDSGTSAPLPLGVGDGFTTNLLNHNHDGGKWQLDPQSRVSVVLQGQLEGFVLKHNVWTIISDNGVSVSRRYSDFTWLLDCLVRRYPFRLLPALPPKRIQVSGHYLATDDLFLDRRRRGLERALTALTHHPVVKHDGLLRVFLEEQGDLTIWRKHNPITLSEESITRALSATEESSLPSDLDSRLTSLRQRITPLVEAWTRIVSHSERLAHRRLNQGGEYRKVSEALQGALTVEREGWRVKEVERVEREVEAAAKVMGGVGETEEESARRKLDAFVEDAKRHREIYINLRDLFHRQTTLGVDHIDKLKKRVETNLSKLSILNSTTPPPSTFAADAEKLTSLVEQDQREIEGLLRRRAFVRWCVWEEVRWGMRCTSLLSLSLREFASSETFAHPSHPSPTHPAFILSGFQDDDGADFGDLLNPSNSVFGASSTYSAFGPPQDDDDLAANPFADLASSSANLQSSYYTEPEPETLRGPESAYEAESAYRPASPFQPEPEYQEPFQPEESLPPPVPTVSEPSTPVSSETVARASHFRRESAPEPETPAAPPRINYAPGDPDGFTYNPYATSPPRSSLYSPASPAGIDEPPTFTHVREKSKPDLSALLGDDKPALPSFRRERSEAAGSMMSKSAILPTRSAIGIGKKPVGGALAALLGMDAEEEGKEVKKEEPKSREAVTAAAAASKPAGVQPLPAGPAPKMDAAKSPTPSPPPTAEEAPLPPDVPAIEPLTSAALETPLPSSRPSTPESAKPPSSDPETPKPPLGRSVSEALTVEAQYDTMVSPLETGETPPADGSDKAWPANKAVEGLDEQLASLKVEDGNEMPSPSDSISTVAPDVTPVPAAAAAAAAISVAANADPSYQQYIFRDDPVSSSSTASAAETEDVAIPSTSSATRGFRAFNGSGDEGGFGGGGGFGAPGMEDTDSLKGAYSRSEEVTEGEEVEAGGEAQLTQRAVGAQDGMGRQEREVSAPLPPLPPSAPSIQGSPRSTQLGGSLGPTFVITVGDPQTVGSALNPAAQHTVYTVRTRTTSSTYRKSDFSVLRRYSHFVWLYEALVQNNPGVIVPGMPEKHAIGRFGSEFVENRRLGLQAALNKIVSHPMLVGDPDLRLFLESDSFHIDIKQRKLDTTAENKGFLSGFSSFSGPKFVEHDEYFDQRKQQLDAFETQLRSLLVSLSNAAKARSALHASIAELQSAFLALAQCDLSSSLRKLYNEAAAVQKKIHDLAEAQCMQEEQIGGLVSVAESYARLCASAKGVFGARIKAYHHWQATETNFRKLQGQHDKAKKTGRAHSELLNLSVAEVADDGSLRLVFGNQAERKMLDARHDFDDVSKLTKAEMARVDKEKVDDFKKALVEFADSLAVRQRQVVEVWQEYHDLIAKAVEAHSTRPQSRPSDSSPLAVAAS